MTAFSDGCNFCSANKPLTIKSISTALKLSTVLLLELAFHGFGVKVGVLTKCAESAHCLAHSAYLIALIELRNAMQAQKIDTSVNTHCTISNVSLLIVSSQSQAALSRRS